MSQSSGMWCCATGPVVQTFWRIAVPSSTRSSSPRTLTLMMTALQSSETLEITHSTTQHHSPDNLNIHQHCFSSDPCCFTGWCNMPYATQAQHLQHAGRWNRGRYTLALTPSSRQLLCSLMSPLSDSIPWHSISIDRIIVDLQGVMRSSVLHWITAGARWIFHKCVPSRRCQLPRLRGISGRCMNGYGPMVEGYWQEKTEVLREKPAPMPICPQQIPHGLVWNWT